MRFSHKPRGKYKEDDWQYIGINNLYKVLKGTKSLIEKMGKRYGPVINERSRND